MGILVNERSYLLVQNPFKNLEVSCILYKGAMPAYFSLSGEVLSIIALLIMGCNTGLLISQCCLKFLTGISLLELSDLISSSTSSTEIVLKLNEDTGTHYFLFSKYWDVVQMS